MTSLFTIISRNYLGVRCLFTIAVLLIAGLWPFNFNPANMVEWLRNGNGIRFIVSYGFPLSAAHVSRIFDSNSL
jgi:hypothetical protein